MIQTISDFPKTLLVALAQDAGKRLTILDKEVDHLVATLRSRILQSKRHLSDGRLIEILPVAKTCEHLLFSVQLLEKEVQELQSHTKALKAEAKELTFVTPAPGRESIWLKLGSLLAAIRFRTCGMVREIGDLHERFDQTLRHMSPDHPEPTVRRLRDTSVSDRYLNELTRWTYRDVAVFAAHQTLLGGHYPYLDIPQVHQLRGYAPNASHYSVMSSDQQAKWRTWWGALAGKTLVPGEPMTRTEKYVTVHTPFWLPDILEVAPVIAHEVAHEVIEDSFGHDTDLERLPSQQDGTPLARLFSGYALTIGRALFPTMPVDSEIAMSHAREFLADFLAFSRFRVAYVYAAFLLMLETGYFAGFCRDSLGHWHLRAILDKWSSPSDKASYKEEVSFLKSLRIGSLETSTNALVFLARIHCLCKLAKNSPGRADENKIINEIELFVEGLVEQATSENGLTPARYRDLINNLSALHDTPAGTFGVSSQSETDSVEYTSFSGAIQALWQPSTDSTNCVTDSPTTESISKEAHSRLYFLNRQRLSGSFYGGPTESAVPHSLRGLFGVFSSAQDIACRYAFFRAEVEIIEESQTNELVKKLDAQYMPIKFAMMEDYVFRTTPPDTFFNALVTNCRTTEERESVQPVLLFDEVFGPKAFPDDYRVDLKAYLKELADRGDSSATNTVDIELHWYVNTLPNTVLRHFLTRNKLIRTSPGSSEIADKLVEKSNVALKAIDRTKLRSGKDQNTSTSLFDEKSNGWLFSLFSIQYKPIEVLAGKVGLQPAMLSKTTFFTKLRQEKNPPDFFLGEILGRYDVAQLHPITGEDSNAKSISDHIGEAQSINFVKYEHKLVNIGPVGAIDQILVIISVALVSPIAHRSFAYWLKNEASKKGEYEGLFINTFASEGWEDFVIAVSTNNVNSKAKVFEPIGKLVNLISSHALSYKTETLFTQKALDAKLIDFSAELGVEFRFRCRAESLGELDSVKMQGDWNVALQERLKGDFPGVEPAKFASLIVVRMLTGLTDFEIRLDQTKLLALNSDVQLSVVALMRDIINEDARIQRLNTQIAFR
jgi:hypothetical protein